MCAYNTFSFSGIYCTQLFFVCDSLQLNTFQAVLITDGVESYTVFLYMCDLIQWSFGGPNIGFAGRTTIGYNAAGDFFENHPSSGDARNVDCLSQPLSPWVNVVYRLSVDNPVTAGPLPTVEPGI